MHVYVVRGALGVSIFSVSYLLEKNLGSGEGVTNSEIKDGHVQDMCML